MTIFDALILGIIQGITEFLPISSSGHLVLAQSILGINQQGNELEILVHIGTLASILVVFLKDIKSIFFSIKSKNTQIFIYFIIIGTIPAVILGLGLKDFLLPLFENILAVGIALASTGIILCGSYFIKKQGKELSYLKSIIIGFAQAVAIIPGISRSGMTITCALFLGLNSKDAAKFSFLLAIPIILGSGLFTFIDIDGDFQIKIEIALAGLISSFIVGMVSLRWLIHILEKGKLYSFGLYCICIGILTIIS